jgi:hypothetical protein
VTQLLSHLSQSPLCSTPQILLLLCSPNSCLPYSVLPQSSGQEGSTLVVMVVVTMVLLHPRSG